ncbi:MAG: hypothetical protein Q7T20_19380 [Saprospiraceae bacterium]|nr:hypothetical protein [Saprospiraceae bacterium]
MRKSIPCILLIVMFAGPLMAQLENKGWWTRDLLSYRSDHEPNGGSSGLGRTTGRFLTQPEIGYTLNKRCLLGLIMQYSHSFERQEIAPNSSGLLRSDDRYFGAGPLFRYFIPLGKRVSLMPELFFTYFYGENTKTTTNAGLETKTRTATHSIGTGAFPSLVCFLTRDLALSLTVASVQYYGNKGGQTFIVEVNPQQWLLGVEYYFEKKKQAESKIN